MSIGQIICRECREGKHVNCDGTAWSVTLDQSVECDCEDLSHAHEVEDRCGHFGGGYARDECPVCSPPMQGERGREPLVPYPSPEGPTSGFSGTDTSEQRARTEDADGTTADRQRITTAHLMRAGRRGMTVKDLREATGWHHGRASSVLSVLHREGVIARLAEVRDRCHVYVTVPEVHGRETQPHGRAKPKMTDEEALIDVVARRVIANTFTPIEVVWDFWEFYPEIGQHDWRRIEERIEHLITSINPSDETYDKAYAELEGRAEDDQTE